MMVRSGRPLTWCAPGLLLAAALVALTASPLVGADGPKPLSERRVDTLRRLIRESLLASPGISDFRITKTVLGKFRVDDNCPALPAGLLLTEADYRQAARERTAALVPNHLLAVVDAAFSGESEPVTKKSQRPEILS